MKHHQEEAVRRELAARQVVFFFGARGTGKTCLKGNLAHALRDSGITVIEIEAADVSTPGDLNEPLMAALGAELSFLNNENFPDVAPIRVLIDSCEQLHAQSWFPVVQDQWRGVLSLEAARGRLGLLLLGRPLFRSATTGRGSPLLNIGCVLTARPMTSAEASLGFGVDHGLAAIAVRKTGGNPYLTGRLLEHLQDGADDLGPKIKNFASEMRRHVMRLIDDHGIAARGIVADLLDAKQPVASSALIRHHFGESTIEGAECLEDLAGSGLLEVEDGYWRLKAEFVKVVPDLRAIVGAPAIELPERPTPSFHRAAEAVFVAENRLRTQFASWLAEADQAWWPSRIPSGLDADAELRRRAELDSRVAPTTDQHPLLYVTFGELVSAISAAHNWEQVFHVRLRLTRTAFDEAIKDFIAVRNKVAHSREVSEEDVVLLESAIERLQVADDE